MTGETDDSGLVLPICSSLAALHYGCSFRRHLSALRITFERPDLLLSPHFFRQWAADSCLLLHFGEGGSSQHGRVAERQAAARFQDFSDAAQLHTLVVAVERWRLLGCRSPCA